MIKVVVDTNVLISAILFGGTPEKIWELVEQKVIEIFISPEMLKELQDVLEKKFDFNVTMSMETLANIKELSTLVEPVLKLKVIKEKESDNRILECAVKENVQYIISGDKRHLLPLKKYRDIKIISPAEFLEIMDETLPAPESG